jgi:hypothetical protein
MHHLKTKFRLYASIHIWLSKGDYHLIQNTGVLRNGCKIVPYCGLLISDQIYFADNSAIFRPPEPGAGSQIPLPPPDHTGGFVSTDGAQGDGTATLS